MICFFASDLHGDTHRYQRLFEAIEREPPAAVLLGGDLLPGPFGRRRTPQPGHESFPDQFLAPGFHRLRGRLGDAYPRIFTILGNDDARAFEPLFLEAERAGLWTYANEKRSALGDYSVYGYCYVPPTPFLLKDWERYDVSRYVDPGCVSPEEGRLSVPRPAERRRYATIRQDLELLAGDDDLERAVFLFHTPPHRTKLDLAALEGQTIDHAPLDPHIGSIAVRRFIEKRQPRITLHGHVHESARLTGDWRDRIGATFLFGAAHDGPELALVRVNLERPEGAERRLL